VTVTAGAGVSGADEGAAVEPNEVGDVTGAVGGTEVGAAVGAGVGDCIDLPDIEARQVSTALCIASSWLESKAGGLPGSGIGSVTPR
jgi:hypothetical protein